MRRFLVLTVLALVSVVGLVMVAGCGGSIEPCPTTEEAAYLNEVLKYTETGSSGMQRFSSLNLRAGENPFLIFDETWKVEIVLTLALLDSGAEEILEVNVPKSMRDVHTDIEASAMGVQRTVVLYAEGIDAVDADKLAQAAGSLAQATSRLDSAASKIEALCK